MRIYTKILILIFCFLAQFSIANNFALATIGESCTLDSDCTGSEVCNENSYTCQKASSASPTPSPTPAKSSSGSGTKDAGESFCDPSKGFVFANGMCQPKSPYGTGSLAGSTDLTDLVAKVLKYLLGFAGVIAVIAMVYGGYLYLTSGGNEEQAEKGRTALVNSAIGIVVIVMAYSIVNIVVREITK